jgi:hypothetical protein
MRIETGNTVAAGVCMILSSSLLIISEIVDFYGYLGGVGLRAGDLWIYFPYTFVPLTFGVFALVGAILTFSRKHLLFIVFSAAVLIFVSTQSLSAILGILVSNQLRYMGFSLSSIVAFSISPFVLALSTVSLILLAKGRSEFH